MSRSAVVERNTLETQINIELELDGAGQSQFNFNVPFLAHMLEQITKHGQLNLTINAQGDQEIDDHHLVEDIGITLGQALKQAVGDKAGIFRYGHAYVPLDESLSRVVLDLSGRPGLFFDVEFTRSRVGQFDIDLIREFFQGLVNHAQITLHIDNLKPGNTHHQAESIFKAFGKSLRFALMLDKQTEGNIPSTKGQL